MDTHSRKVRAGFPLNLLLVIAFGLTAIGLLVVAAVIDPAQMAEDGSMPARWGALGGAGMFLVMTILLIIASAVSSRRAAYMDRNGLDATATILSAEQTGLFRNESTPELRFQLEVQRASEAPYRVMHTQYFGILEIGRVQPGVNVRVKVDPKDREHLAIV